MSKDWYLETLRLTSFDVVMDLDNFQEVVSRIAGQAPTKLIVDRMQNLLVAHCESAGGILTFTNHNGTFNIEFVQNPNDENFPKLTLWSEREFFFQKLKKWVGTRQCSRLALSGGIIQEFGDRLSAVAFMRTLLANVHIPDGSIDFLYQTNVPKVSSSTKNVLLNRVLSFSVQEWQVATTLAPNMKPSIAKNGIVARIGFDLNTTVETTLTKDINQTELLAEFLNELAPLGRSSREHSPEAV